MDHNEAVQQMAAERYLLDELTAEQRDAFEEHAFDCAECALDLRAGAMFIHEAKAELPNLPQAAQPAQVVRSPRKPWWSLILQPAFAAPVFACMLGIIAFQNLETIPSLRSAADSPRVAPWSTMHLGTRGGAHTAVLADRKHGAVLLIDAPQNSAFTSYAFELYDPSNKLSWSQVVPVTTDSVAENATLSLYLPASRLQAGSYSLVISGITSSGERTKVDQRVLDIHF